MSRQQQKEMAVLNHVADEIFKHLQILGKQYDSNPLPQNIENSVQVIFDVLRKILNKDETLVYDIGLLVKLENILNKDAPIDAAFDEKNRIHLYYGDGAALRQLAEASMRYVNILHDTPDDLLMLAPINVCPRCSAIFKKNRSDQKYCSKQCRFALWAGEKGNRYFAEKAKKNRLVKKKQKESCPGNADVAIS